MSSNPAFEKLESIASEQGIKAALEYLVQHFRDSGSHHELFEVLKMQVRDGLGLPLLYQQEPDDLTEEQQRALEDGLLDACREVGTSLMERGNFREGWMYLQPLGDRNLVRELFAKIKIDEENISDLVEITLSQGAAPELGYDIVLKEFGTCNAITTFDTQVHQFDKNTQKKLAGQLARHIYEELRTNVRNHVAEQESVEIDESTTLIEMVQAKPWLTQDGNHHLDTTHLASLMRIGRGVDEADAIQMLAELADYGSRLHKDFHYASAPPFEDTYTDHLFYYQALTGLKPDAAIAHFKAKANATDQSQYGTVAVETLIDLLHRIGRSAEAIEFAIEELMGKDNQIGLAPNVFEMASSQNDLSLLIEHYRAKDDLLGYSVGLLKKLQ